MSKLNSPKEKPISTRASRRQSPRLAARTPVSTRPVLDPHGLYGTRAVQRRRAVKRRRQLQNAMLLLVLAVLVAFAVWRWQTTRALSAASSQRIKLNQMPSAAPLQTDSALFVPTFGGQLWALRNENLRDVQKFFAADFSLRATPISLDAAIVFAAEDGSVYRVDDNGKVIWKWRASASIATRPLAVRVLDSPKIVVFGDDKGEVVALDAADGTMKWTRNVGAPVGNALAASADGNSVFAPLLGNIRNRGGLVCLNAKNGAIRWKKELGAASVAAVVAGATSPQGKDERVFSGADNGSILCLDATRKRVWKTFVQPLIKTKTDDVVVLRGEPSLKVYRWGARLFIGGNDGVLRCLDAKQGREQWNFATGAPLLQRAFSVQIAQNGDAHDAILLGAKTRLCALDAKNGALLWSAQTSGETAAWSARGKIAWSVSRDGVAERFVLP